MLADLRRPAATRPRGVPGRVEGAGGYRVVEFPEDTSKWVLPEARRAGGSSTSTRPDGRAVTVRVRATGLTTAVDGAGVVGVHGGDPLDRKVVNAVRDDAWAWPPSAVTRPGRRGSGR